MRALLLVALAALLGACTGENVDEAFLLAHGASLAELRCEGDMDVVNESKSIRYQANLFYDGSALVLPRGFGDTELFSRGTIPTGWELAAGSAATSPCTIAAQRVLLIDDGQLEWWNCKTGGDELAATMDLDTDCTGFNKHLFD